MGQLIFADDEEGIRAICRMIISREFPGYELAFFPDGTSLAGRLESDVSNVNLVFTDNNMPGVNGSELIERYARDPRFVGRIPMILAYSGDEIIGKKAVEDGAFAYLLKPFGKAQLVSIVQRALSRD